MCAHTHAWRLENKLWSWFSFSIVWILGFEHRSQGLVAILLALEEGIWYDSQHYFGAAIFAIFSSFVRTSIAAEHAKKNGLQTNATSPHASVPTSRLHMEKPAVYKYVLWHVFWIERCQDAATEMSRFCCTGSLAWVRLLQGQVKMIALFMLRWSLLIAKKQRGAVLTPFKCLLLWPCHWMRSDPLE